MTVTVTSQWQKAMERALTHRPLKPTRCTNGDYRVPSASRPGTVHTVSLKAGHIVSCDCKGWERGGRQHPCWHAGAVALAIMFIRGDAVVPARRPAIAPVIEATTTRDQIYRAA